MPLINRNVQIPNGMSFYCPVTKYSAAAYTSFRVICEGWAQAIRVNGVVARAHGLPQKMHEREAAVDAYQCALCGQRAGGERFVQGVAQGQSPFRGRKLPVKVAGQERGPGLARNVQAVVTGSRVILKWLSSGAEAVPKEVAEKRAEVCAVCPVNSKNSEKPKPMSAWFTVPAQNAILEAVQNLMRWNLKTSVHEKLGVCEACECPLPLKTQMPLDKFLPEMDAVVLARLDSGCWILAEKDGKPES